ICIPALEGIDDAFTDARPQRVHRWVVDGDDTHTVFDFESHHVRFAHLSSSSGRMNSCAISQHLARSHWAEIAASRISLPHFATSRWMYAANCSGLRLPGSNACDAKRSAMSRRARTFTMSLFRRAMMSRGVA